MENYIAKKVTLDTVRECNGNCGCYTNSGFYIHYQKRNVDSILFVCEECYYRQYRSKCTLGNFEENNYIRSSHGNSYHFGISKFLNIAAAINKGIRALRIALLILMILFLAFCIKEQPSIRSEFSMPKVNTVTWNINGLNERIERINVQVERVITHGEDL